jgi:hypothetical protein
MAALGSTTPERQHMNKAYSHNDHHWGITITIKRCYHVKHLYYRSDRTCFNFFAKIYWTSNMCFGFVHNVSLKHFSFLEEFSIILSLICICLHANYMLFLSDFNETGISSTIHIFSVGAELLHADRQKDWLEESNSRFSRFCEKPLKITGDFFLGGWEGSNIKRNAVWNIKASITEWY